MFRPELKHRPDRLRWGMLLLLSCLILAMPRPCTGADGSGGGGGFAAFRPTMDKACNPRPLSGDLELPMPCGLKMVLRYVCVGAGGYFRDNVVVMGCGPNCGQSESPFMDGRYRASISGTFLAEDLPPAWRRTVSDMASGGDGRCPPPGNKPLRGFYYFIGKYEVSVLQYKAVMEGKCLPKGQAPGSDDLRPQVDVSWFQVQEFMARYTEWLLKNHPEALPKFGNDRTGYLRLPTETEWEYAARGGHRVDELSITQEVFFPLEGKDLADYAVFDDPGAAKPVQGLAWIGTKSPNPLGLYDTAGNAAEMVGSHFQYTFGNRRHGAVGGFVAKGGDCLSSRDGVLPGRRQEAPYFLADGPYHSKYLGFRVVLGGIITPEERFGGLVEEWKRSGEELARAEASQAGRGMGAMDQSADPIKEIDRLVEATEDKNTKKNLLFLRGIIKDNNISLQERLADNLRGAMRGAIFAQEAAYNYQVRAKILKGMERQARAALKVADIKKVSNDAVEKLKTQLRRYEALATPLDNAIDHSVRYYISLIKETGSYPIQVQDEQLARLEHDFPRNNPFNKTVQRRLALFRKHLNIYRKQGEAALDREAIKTEIFK